MAARKKPGDTTIVGLDRRDQLVTKLAEVRGSRTRAETAGKMTCVPQLHRLELGILEDLAAISGASSDVSGLSTDDLVEVIVSVVPDLSGAAAKKLEAALSARPPHLRIASGG